MMKVNPLVGSWIQIVHESAVEIGVTLLVDGQVVSGIMTPYQVYERWEKEVIERAVAAGGRTTPTKLPPLSREMAEAVKAEWPAMEETQRKAEGDEAFGPFRYVCLRDVVVFSGAGSLQLTVLLVRSDRVAAMTLGNIKLPG